MLLWLLRLLSAGFRLLRVLRGAELAVEAEPADSDARALHNLPATIPSD
jgi:hypothetical protein